jgi:hypothetical protein
VGPREGEPGLRHRRGGAEQPRVVIDLDRSMKASDLKGNRRRIRHQRDDQRPDGQGRGAARPADLRADRGEDMRACRNGIMPPSRACGGPSSHLASIHRRPKILVPTPERPRHQKE